MTTWKICCSGTNSMEQDSLQWDFGAGRVHPSSMLFVEVFWHSLKLSTRCTGSRASWEVQAKVSCHLCPAWGH